MKHSQNEKRYTKTRQIKFYTKDFINLKKLFLCLDKNQILQLSIYSKIKI
ncbi:hypothetical protein CAMSH0001_1487 [Campylobacter showae RM3277]|uniref:Uncharacterized protein n=1 Tax=Campylobacter showae RM3277 TaxID=553219 RepID=C6RCQ1_9BACT|nr:hypothetical protein CAMSH0001_1487 [Campylobacter showae RM3277]